MFKFYSRRMLRSPESEGAGGGTAGNLADAIDASESAAEAPATPATPETPASGEVPKTPPAPPAPSTPETPATPGELPLSVTDGFDISTVPEKFVKDGKVDVEGVLAGFSELEKGQSKNDGFIGEVPEKYSFTHPTIEGVDDDRIKQTIKDGDPIVASFQEFAKGKNFTQKAHDEMMGWFVGASIEAQKHVIAGEMEALGDKGVELVSVNSKFFKANLSEAGFKGIREAMVSAGAVNAINEIRLAMGDTVVPGEGGDDVPGSLTEQSLRDKMKLDAYWDQNHADYNKLRDEVEKGFKGVYKESGT